MADDYGEVLRKMLDSSRGMETHDSDTLTIANHIDYDKWNNHQRLESTGPVFRVMGQFLGYPRLTERTHEFFQKIQFYYGDRPDLINITPDNKMENKTDFLACWDGQLGGIDGLRQEGWTILGLLTILRESKVRNTKVKVLAQGDNQIVCNHYKLAKNLTEEEREQNILRITENNNIIMDRIMDGAKRLGLLINDDETLQSFNIINYGKMILINGVMLG